MDKGKVTKKFYGGGLRGWILAFLSIGFSLWLTHARMTRPVHAAASIGVRISMLR